MYNPSFFGSIYLSPAEIIYLFFSVFPPSWMCLFANDIHY
jgi:hypothetical protein